MSGVCPTCGGCGAAIEFTQMEAFSAMRAGRTAAAHPVIAAAVAAWLGAKYFCSQAYRCIACGHQWREWFK